MRSSRCGLSALILTILLSSAYAATPGLPDWLNKAGANWQPPADGVVRDSRAAITIARAIWISTYPERAATTGDEAVWQSQMDATLHNGIWEVTKKMGPDDYGGSLFIYISKRDGRVVGIYITQ
jgi:hypothetical protein